MPCASSTTPTMFISLLFPRSPSDILRDTAASIYQPKRHSNGNFTAEQNTRAMNDIEYGVLEVLYSNWSLANRSPLHTVTTRPRHINTKSKCKIVKVCMCHRSRPTELGVQKIFGCNRIYILNLIYTHCRSGAHTVSRMKNSNIRLQTLAAGHSCARKWPCHDSILT